MADPIVGDDAAPPPGRRRLGLAAAAALVAAVLVLVLFILPAEYGLDPTGVGGLFGLTKLAGTGGSATNDTGNVTTQYVYRLHWKAESTPLPAVDGYASERTTVPVAFAVDKPNVVRLDANLTWTDANETAGQTTRPDFFEVQIEGPDGRRGPAAIGRDGADGKGNVTATLEWVAVPTPADVPAADGAEAERQAALLNPTDGSGVGQWKVHVSLPEAGDADAQGVPVGAGPAADTGNTWHLELTLVTYGFDATDLESSKLRQDVVTVTVPPGRGIEYKFSMREGDPIEYEWNTTGARLYYDFHGEPAGGEPGEFTSHRSGTAARDGGRLVAPFEGTHGWYWENREPAPVTVQLVTSGVYTVLGKP